jgi:hypothetical protein
MHGREPLPKERHLLFSSKEGEADGKPRKTVSDTGVGFLALYYLYGEF